MTRNNNTIDATTKLTQAATGGAFIVDWDLRGSRLTPDEIRQVLQAHNFDASVVPDIDQPKAVFDAARGWEKRRAGYSARVVSGGPKEDTTVIGVRKDQPGQKRNDAMQFTTITFDNRTNSWEPVTYTGEHLPALREVIAACDRERRYLDCDFIRPVLIQAKLKTMGSVSLIRRSGGAQVVAAAHADELNRLADMICNLGDCYMGVVSADLSKYRTVTAVKRCVQEGLMGEITKAREELRMWRERGTRIPRVSIGKRIERFKSLKAEITMYADCLQLRVDDLHKDLAEADADAKDLLAVALGEKPAQEAAAAK